MPEHDRRGHQRGGYAGQNGGAERGARLTQQTSARAGPLVATVEGTRPEQRRGREPGELKSGVEQPERLPGDKEERRGEERMHGQWPTPDELGGEHGDRHDAGTRRARRGPGEHDVRDHERDRDAERRDARTDRRRDAHAAPADALEERQHRGTEQRQVRAAHREHMRGAVGGECIAQRGIEATARPGDHRDEHPGLARGQIREQVRFHAQPESVDRPDGTGCGPRNDHRVACDEGSAEPGADRPRARIPRVLVQRGRWGDELGAHDELVAARDPGGEAGAAEVEVVAHARPFAVGSAAGERADAEHAVRRVGPRPLDDTDDPQRFSRRRAPREQCLGLGARAFRRDQAEPASDRDDRHGAKRGRARREREREPRRDEYRCAEEGHDGPRAEPRRGTDNERDREEGKQQPHERSGATSTRAGDATRAPVDVAGSMLRRGRACEVRATGRRNRGARAGVALTRPRRGR